MIIPLGHDQHIIHRRPLVTLGIMLICVLVFILTRSSDARDNARLDHDLGLVVSYFNSHPYLRLTPRIRQLAGGNIRDDATRQPHPQRPTTAVRAREQLKLNQLERRAWNSFRTSITTRLGAVPADLTLFRALSSIFMHSDWLHLLGNLFFLYLVGPFLEDVWGRTIFTAVFLAAGVVAVAGHTATHPHSVIPMIGASGAIAGLMGAFLVRFWRTRFRLMYWGVLIAPMTFHAPAWLVLPAWLFNEIIATRWELVPGGNSVAHSAHVAGFLGGMGLAAVLVLSRAEDRFLAPLIESRRDIHPRPRVQLALKLERRGAFLGAFRELANATRQAPDDDSTVLEFWRLAGRVGQAPVAASALGGVVRRWVRAGDTRAALPHWLELRRQAPEHRLDPGTVLALLEVLLDLGLADEAVAALDDHLWRWVPGLAPATRQHLESLAERLDVASVVRALDRALDVPGLPPDLCRDLERIRDRRRAREQRQGPIAGRRDDPAYTE